MARGNGHALQLNQTLEQLEVHADEIIATLQTRNAELRNAIEDVQTWADSMGGIGPGDEPYERLISLIG